MWLTGYKKEGYDIHKETSVIVFGREHKNEEERKFAKNFNFAMLYGAGAPRIAIMLQELFGGTKKEHMEKAGQMVSAFRRAHPNLKKYERYAYQRILKDNILNQERPWMTCRDVAWQGYIVNRYGRRYCLPPFLVYKWLEYITSGDASGDMLKAKFLEVATKFQNKCNILRLTHDEIVVEIADTTNQSQMVQEIKEIMEDIPKLKNIVPILVDVEYGKDCLRIKTWEGTNGFSITN